MYEGHFVIKWGSKSVNGAVIGFDSEEEADQFCLNFFQQANNNTTKFLIFKTDRGWTTLGEDVIKKATFHFYINEVKSD